uniref:Negatively light-regulated protein n=1 Tax=Oryza glumipatula TaxID=40148 RepID=A0A0E0A2V9_9ORYZ
MRSAPFAAIGSPSFCLFDPFPLLLLPSTSTRSSPPRLEPSMSGKPSDDTTGQVRPEVDGSDEKVEIANQNEKEVMPSPQEEEAAIKKKYGGIVPRKPALIAKDHERAYFDSADWALGKQGGHPQKPKGPLEALRPKLQPTQQQARSRRFLHASVDNEEGLNSPTEDASQNQESNEVKDEK